MRTPVARSNGFSHETLALAPIARPGRVARSRLRAGQRTDTGYPGFQLTDLFVPRLPRVARWAVPLIVFLYLIYVRTRGISQTFWLLGDQILYWRIALGSWRDLPIGGGPSSVGGTTLGPVFCWVLWIIRHLVGPWTQNLPHAGAIGLAIIQSAADALLLVAIWKRFTSLALAFAVTLLVATAPYDMALTATIWNPPLAVAFVKIALALALLGDLGDSDWWCAGATAAALLAVQAHSSGAFFAAPVIASFTIRELVARRYTRAMQVAGVSAAVIVILELPFLINLAMQPGKGTSPAIVVSNVSYTLMHPQALRPVRSFRALADACEFILIRPWTFGWFGALLAASAAATAYRMRQNVIVAASTVAPLVCAVAGFSFWQLPFDHYWFLTVAPSAALTIVLALTAWRPASASVALLLAAMVIVSQPWRLADAMTFHRLPEYAPLARGSREIRRRVLDVRRIDTEFPLPPSTDRAFLYEVLGGRVSPDGRLTATIGRTGLVTFTPVPDEKGTDEPGNRLDKPDRRPAQD
jgi:hypothetical protein